jgi:ABC-type lipoprotein export system ATPase subunit
LDVATNVGLALRLDGRPRAEVRARVRELLAAIGLADRAKQPVTQLSGGEAQRVAIAAALAARPMVLLADELTGELDEESAASALDLLAAMRRQEGTVVLTVTHNQLVTARADQRLVMRDDLVVPAA